jgi:tRNA A-37 threonylcarbamoyl transferase component Bud32
MGVPRMYHFKTCDKRDVLYFEYIDGVPLEKWIRSNPGISEYKSVIRQVISNLYKIHQKYPEFRHHDLHWNNVMITKNGKPIMIDFGLAVMKGIKNPDVNAGDFLTSGISRKSHPIYDAHYFLNIVQTYTHSKIIRDFIRDLFKYPNDYLVRNSSYVSDMRLRLVKHKELPTFESILSHPFLTGKKEDVVKKILNAVTKTKKNLAPRVIIAPKSKIENKKIPGETAIERAKRILAEAAEKKRAPIRRPGIVAKRKPSVKSQVREIEHKMKTPTPKVPVYKFTNVKGKERVYKKKGWYEKALAKNRAARAAKNNDETLASLMKKLKVRS